MKVILLGQKWLAAEVAKALDAAGRPLSGVCPDTLGGSLADTARALGTPVIEFEGIPECDLMIAAHCHRYIPAAMRARSRLGVLAYHPSLLPRHRGRDAVIWTIAFGDAITGGTTYWMDDAADAGPIEAQRWCHVARGDTPESLWRRDLGPMGVDMLADAVKRLGSGMPPCRAPQNDRYATWEPSLRRPPLRGG